MSKIKIKNFGPIKEGYQEDSGFMDVKKVTVFIGNQGSGKSTAAKIISTLSWMEKAINRGDIREPKSPSEFKEHFRYQNLTTYFKDNTIIEYYGDAYSIVYNAENKPYTITSKNNSVKYTVPKIVYVPAERNFLTVIKNATGVRGLPETLFDFAEQLKLSQNDLKEDITLPINGVSYKYDKVSDSSFIIGPDFNVNLLVASSGFQSIVPLYLVSLSTALIVLNSSDINSSNINVMQSIRMNEEIAKINMDNEISDAEKKQLSNDIRVKFKNKCFINIVEEPEQNLYPTAQWEMLKSLLKYNNMSEGNKLILTTHSPYIVNYLNIAIQGKSLYNKIEGHQNKNVLYPKLSNIVPRDSLLASDTIAVYQLKETDGTINKLSTYEGVLSDKNYLNMMLREGNHLFDSLLELEEEL